MLSNVFLKTLRDQRKTGFFWVAGIVAISAYVMFLYPIIAEDPGLNAFIQDLPEVFKALFGGVLDYTTANGFLDAQLYTVIAPLVLIVYAVVQGVGAIAGEEERGTLGLLLSNPVPRSKVVLHKAAAMTLGVVVGAFALWCGLLLFAQVNDVSIRVKGLTHGTVSLGLVVLFFGAMSLAVGAATGRRGLSAGLTGGYGVAAYLLNSFIPLVDWLRPARFITPFYYYSANDPLVRGLSLSHALTLVGASLALVAFAVWAFERRDLVK